jgi:predicted RNase H-like HicB family nuclease
MHEMRETSRVLYLEEVDRGGLTMAPSNKARQYRYTVVYQPMPEGGFSVIVPAIPEICTFGETREEARRMAEDAIRCFLESALKTGEPIPEDFTPTTEEVAVALR